MSSKWPAKGSRELEPVCLLQFRVQIAILACALPETYGWILRFLKINKSNEPDNTINDTANQYLEIYTSSSTSTTTNPPIETITTTTTKYRKQEVNVETLDELKKSYRCSKFNCKYN